MIQSENSKKKTFLRRNLDLLLVFAIITSVYYIHVLTQPVSPFEPRKESYAPFERHYHWDWRFPFITSYFLMVPENYQPQKNTYPLVMMLHGGSRHMYGGKVLMRSEMRHYFPFFVLIPIAPFGFVWALPDATLRPRALPLAMDVMDHIQTNYSVNPRQIYVTGYSMGGLGTYGALARYHDVFAAAAPTDAVWDPAQVVRMDDIPVYIFHGTQDTQMPVANSRTMAYQMKQAGRTVFYTEYSNRGHGAWIPAYENPEFWSWLIRQKKQ